MKYFVNNADANIFYKTCENIDTVPKTLRMSAEKLFEWFDDNQMKDNTNKFHLIVRTGNSSQINSKHSLSINLLSLKNSLVLNLIIN